MAFFFVGGGPHFRGIVSEGAAPCGGEANKRNSGKNGRAGSKGARGGEGVRESRYAAKTES